MQFKQWINSDPNVNLNKQKIKAWERIVSTNFPGGEFYKMGPGQTYETEFAGRDVDFSIRQDPNDGLLYASIGFNWKNESPVLNQFTRGNPLQKGSINFMKTLRDKYIVPLSNYQISVQIYASDKKREQLYKKGMESLGYKQKQDQEGIKTYAI